MAEIIPERNKGIEIPALGEGKEPVTTLKVLLRYLFRGRTLGIASIIIIWQLVSMFSPEDTLPTPYVVFKVLIFNVILEKKFFLHVGATLLRIIIGFCIASAIGFGMGVLMGITRYWEKFFLDYVTVGLTLPTLTWAIIGVLWFGIHPLTPTFSAVLIAFPYVAVNIWAGIKDVDKELIEMGRAFDAPKRRIIWHVYFPSLLPFIFAAIRIGISVSWKIVVLAEVFGSSEGIGYMIFYWYQMFDMESVLAWVLVFVFIMLILEYGILKRLERRLLIWRPQAIL
ncbi:ABC transporter permease [Thermodesulfobacteriota bacterium]